MSGGLYNRAFTQWPGHAHLLVGLGLTATEEGKTNIHPLVPRYRDAYPVLREGAWEFHVLTRAGGPNRAELKEGIAYMQASPLYIDDEDESYDTTYATFRFRPPPDAAEVVARLEEAGEAASMPPFEERWARKKS
jgi:hypothetical protein